jgi:hypothetical protein
MRPSNTQSDSITVGPKPFSYRSRLREISMFFEGNDRVHETMNRVCAKLEGAGISYAIIGGMAVNAHRLRRTTGDVDFLLSSDGFKAFVQLVTSDEFQRVSGRPRRFLDRSTGVTFVFLIAGRFPGNGRPGPIAFPDPAAVCEVIDSRQVIKLANLIELKLAARRYKDFGDVVELIRAHNLDEAYAKHLHPSVHTDYIECLEEKRREDEYEAREDEAAEGPSEKDDS